MSASDAAVAVMGLLTGLFVGSLLTAMYANKDKAECEKFLPRNIECVWAAPTTREPTP